LQKYLVRDEAIVNNSGQLTQTHKRNGLVLNMCAMYHMVSLQATGYRECGIRLRRILNHSKKIQLRENHANHENIETLLSFYISSKFRVHGDVPIRTKLSK
jgi:hypothetical protein